MGKTILQILKTGVFLFLVSNDIETSNSLGQFFVMAMLYQGENG